MDTLITFLDLTGYVDGSYPYPTSIVANHTPSHTPKHNGVTEKKHRHIIETSLTLLHQANIPKTFWPYAFQTATYLISMMPSPNTSKSPYKFLYKKDLITTTKN